MSQTLSADRSNHPKRLADYAASSIFASRTVGT